MSIEIDLSMTLGNIVEIGVLAVGAVVGFTVLKVTVGTLQISVTESKQETREQFSSVQIELKKIGDVLVNQADQNRRIIHLEDDMREMRHGRGFIFPAGMEVASS